MGEVLVKTGSCDERTLIEVVKIRIRLCPWWMSPFSQSKNNNSLYSLRLIPQPGPLPILAVHESKR